MTDYIQVNKTTYDQLAIEYKHRRENISVYEERTEYLGNSVLKYITGNNIHVLEIGPGAGQLLAFFEKNGCRTVGVELSTNMARVAKEHSSNSIIINQDINTIDFLSNQFDIIYMGAVIHLFPKDDAILLMKKVERWLKPNGVVFINTTCHHSSKEGFFNKADYSCSSVRFRRYLTEDELIQEVEQCGLRIIDKLYTHEKDRDKIWVALIGRKEI